MGEVKMKEVMATVSSKGQVVIPAEVRKHLGIEQGDKVLFVLSEGGQVELKGAKYPTVASLRGAAGKLPQPLSWEEMRQIAREDHIKGSRSSK
jgi:AbrB family looped-hinge helix DNA binding protein